MACQYNHGIAFEFISDSYTMNKLYSLQL